jgi:hypothetical protein
VTVDLASSGVVGPGLATPAGVRSDTLYVHLEGTPSLCATNQLVDLGRLYLTGAPTAIPGITLRGAGATGLGLDVTAVAESLKHQGSTKSFFELGWLEDPDNLGWITDPGDPVVDPNCGVVEVSMDPAGGQTPGAETLWEVCIEAQCEVNRLSLAFEAPAGTGTSDMKWVGCEGTSQDRTCATAAMAPQYQPWVQPTLGCTFYETPPCPSYTTGPNPADSVPTLFAVLEGGNPSPEEPPLTRLNGAGAKKCIGQVFLNTPGSPPELSIAGVEGLPNQPPILKAVDSNSDFAPDGVSTLDVTLLESASSNASSEDTDNDTVRDEDDNCEFLANTTQDNTGGLLSAVGNDGIGDACQCGDLDFDGRMLAGGADLILLVDVLLGINTAPAVVDRASVVDGPIPTIRDAVFLQRALDGNDPGITQACEDGVLPVP